MPVYVVSDIHSTYSKFLKSIPKNASKIIINGDLFNKGREQEEMLLWLADNYNNDKYVFIFGNHDLILFARLIIQLKRKIDNLMLSEVVENFIMSGKYSNILNVALSMLEDKKIDANTIFNKIIPSFKWYHIERINNKTFIISHASWEMFKQPYNQDKKNLVYDTSLLFNRIMKKDDVQINEYVEYCKDNNITHIFGHFVCDKVFGVDAPVIKRDVFVYIDNGVYSTSNDYVFYQLK